MGTKYRIRGFGKGNWKLEKNEGGGNKVRRKREGMIES